MLKRKERDSDSLIIAGPSKLSRQRQNSKPAANAAVDDGLGGSSEYAIDILSDNDDDDDTPQAAQRIIELNDASDDNVESSGEALTPANRSKGKQTTLPIGGTAAKLAPKNLSLNAHEGPSTSSPLRINAPDFALKDILTQARAKAVLKEPDLDLLYFKTMIKGKELYEYLLNEFPWYRVIYNVRGITIRTPRWTCVWGCDDTRAPPTAYNIQPRSLPTILAQLKDFVEGQTGAKYNFVLVNFYENGNDSISWHSDDESFLGPLPCIASLSLGSPRDFQMKHKFDKTAGVEKWSLESGDMVVMRGTTQSKWLHAVPKRAHAGGRINITFRRAMNVAGTNNYYRYNVYNGPVHRWRKGRMIEA